MSGIIHTGFLFPLPFIHSLLFYKVLHIHARRTGECLRHLAGPCVGPCAARSVGVVALNRFVILLELLLVRFGIAVVAILMVDMLKGKARLLAGFMKRIADGHAKERDDVWRDAEQLGDFF